MDEQPALAVREVPVEFHGTTGEYFRIWIVNLALTIATLGIYSAWATVRKLRYFYGQTEIDGGRFDFHAQPVAILIGRLIALGMLAAYYFSGYISPLLPIAVIVLIFLLVPWLVVRSRIFRLRNTSYRNVRFNFRPAYGDAVSAFYGGALVSVISLGLATPVAIYWKNRFVVDNSALGKSSFRLLSAAGDFFGIFFRTIGLALLGLFAVALFAGALGFLVPGLVPAPDESSEGAAEVASLVFSLPVFLLYFAIFVYSQVRHRNLVYNTSEIEATRFSSTLSVRTMLWLYLSNAIAIISTVGLATPWAQIRMARYRASRTTVLLADDWDAIVADAADGGSAAGDAIGDAFDVGVDIGI